MSSWLDSLVGAAASTVGSLIVNSSNNQTSLADSQTLMKDQYNYNTKLMAAQNDYSVENATTAYNRALAGMDYEFQLGQEYYNQNESIAAQRRQLVEAGYNPNSLVAEGSTGASPLQQGSLPSVQSAGSPSFGSIGATFQSQLPGIMSALTQAFQAPSKIKQADADTDLSVARSVQARADALLAESQTDNVNLQNELQRIVNKYADTKEQQDILLVQQNIQKLLNDNEYFDKYGILGGALQLQNQIFQNTKLDADTKKELLDIEWLPKLYASQAAMNFASAALSGAQTTYYNDVLSENTRAGTAGILQSLGIDSYNFDKQKTLDNLLVGDVGLNVIGQMFNVDRMTAKLIVAQMINGQQYNIAEGSLGMRDIYKHDFDINDFNWNTLNQCVKAISPFTGLLK